MVRRVPRRDCVSGQTRVETSSEPSSRTGEEHQSESPSPRCHPPERYVVCIVSFAGFQSSPFFQSRSTIEASLRARVSLAISSSTPQATQRS